MTFLTVTIHSLRGIRMTLAQMHKKRPPPSTSVRSLSIARHRLGGLFLLLLIHVRAQGRNAIYGFEVPIDALQRHLTFFNSIFGDTLGISGKAIHVRLPDINIYHLFLLFKFTMPTSHGIHTYGLRAGKTKCPSRP